MIKVAFGRCALPHSGHVSLINQVDIFVLSNSAKLPNAELRIKLLQMLGADVSRIRVGVPYECLLAISEEFSEEAVVVSEKANEGLARAVKLNTVPLTKQFGLSSTYIRSLFGEGNYSRLREIYNSEESFALANTLYDH